MARRPQPGGIGVLARVLLEVEGDFGSPPQGVAPGIRGDVEATLTVQALPDVLDGIIRMLGSYSDSVGDQKRGVESDSEHSD